jgi:hypothetical protein
MTAQQVAIKITSSTEIIDNLQKHYDINPELNECYTSSTGLPSVPELLN